MVLTIGQKAGRVLQFLLAIRSMVVAGALGRFGFSDKDLEEGWKLMTRLTQGRLDGVKAPSVDVGLVTQIDAWENLWFPVADATLANKAPDAHAVVFANLSQTSGPAVIVSVSTFVERVEGLDAATRKLLAKRGITAAVLSDAKAMLDRATSLAKDGESPVPTTASTADAEAERALWAWYLEWSSIARVAIKDRRVLRQCGFLKPGKAGAADTAPTATAATAPTNGAAA